MFKLRIYRILLGDKVPTLYEVETQVCPRVGEILAFGEKQYRVMDVSHLYTERDGRLDEVQVRVE